MKSKILTTIVITIIAFISSCTKENNWNSEKNKNVELQDDIILVPRNPKLQRVWSRNNKIKNFSSRMSFTDATDFLGNSYKVENGTSIIGDFANARFPIVSIKKLIERYPSYIVAKELRQTNTEMYSYANFDRLELNSSFSKKVKSGFSLNLGIFKLGRKKTVTEVFIHNTMYDNKVGHGELSIEVVNGMMTLQTVPSALRRISADYLDEIFVDALYNSSMVELMRSYGEFVLTGYYTGGRASALYYGTERTNTSFEQKENSMDKEINASFSWNKSKPVGKDSLNIISGELSIGTNKGNSSAVTNTFSDLKFSIKTLGGAYGYTVATLARVVYNYSLDLTNWLNSLNDTKTHTMIGLQDEGLTPLSDFILEENFKERYNDTHMGFQFQEYLEEPFIEIVKIYIRKSASGDKLYDIVPVLSTRQGDKLIFSNSHLGYQTDAQLKENSTLATFLEKSKLIADAKSQYYKLAIKANPNKIINPISRIPLSFEISNVTETGLYKFKNPNTNIWYIYNPNSLYCFAYYDDDYILDAYGISNWISTIPEKSITMTTLYQRYRIFGL
ncbi:MAC/perforin domain-containing protein [Sphingobacterium sp. MYb382]|uniref:MAC/perforin domain-containing protein n=1 Tax=Sphingobacterium sp. MYb382 TaxID=2745278 RepID=UPI0030AED57C